MRLLARFGALLVAGGAVGFVVGYSLGPVALGLLFGPRYHFARLDLALMALGVVCYLGLVVITQALVAANLHVQVAWSWLAGLLVAGVLYLAVTDIVRAAEFAFLFGSAAGLSFGVSRLPLSGVRRPA
jgi:hypothetical protein